MPPAARVGDLHVCALVTGIVPHVGGPILPPGMPTVLIGGVPAARVGDMATCVGPPDVIAMGSPTVLIGNMMAARLGDPTVHGGVIVAGLPTVMIGVVGAGSVITPSSGFGAAVAQALGGAMAEAGQASEQGTTPQVAALQEAANEGIASVESCPYGEH